MFGREAALFVSSEDLYENALGGFGSARSIETKLSRFGPQIIAFAYRPLNVPAGLTVARFGDKSYLKPHQLILHEEVIAINKNAPNKQGKDNVMLYRGYGKGDGFSADPGWNDYIQSKAYRLQPYVLVLKETADAHEVLEAVGRDPRFSNKGNYDVVKNNCQVYA